MRTTDKDFIITHEPDTIDKNILLNQNVHRKVRIEKQNPRGSKDLLRTVVETSVVMKPGATAVVTVLKCPHNYQYASFIDESILKTEYLKCKYTMNFPTTQPGYCLIS